MLIERGSTLCPAATSPTAGGGDPGDDLAVMGVDREGEADCLAVIATEGSQVGRGPETQGQVNWMPAGEPPNPVHRLRIENASSKGLCRNSSVSWPMIACAISNCFSAIRLVTASRINEIVAARSANRPARAAIISS